MNNHRNQPKPPGYVLLKCFSKARHGDTPLWSQHLETETSRSQSQGQLGLHYQTPSHPVSKRKGVGVGWGSSNWAHTRAVSRAALCGLRPAADSWHRRTTPGPRLGPFPPWWVNSSQSFDPSLLGLRPVHIFSLNLVWHHSNPFNSVPTQREPCPVANSWHHSSMTPGRTNDGCQRETCSPPFESLLTRRT